MSSTGSQVGNLAPDIDLPDGEGNHWMLSSYRGKPVVLLFYPADETPTCTKQLCSVRDNWERYMAAGAEVVGINGDSISKHQKFAANHKLPLRLLSDVEGGVLKAYDMNSFLGVRRGVIVIDKEGVIRYRRTVFPLFRPTDDEIINAIALAEK